MTDTCFANNPNLLAELHSLRAKAARRILCFLFIFFLEQPFLFNPPWAWVQHFREIREFQREGKTKESSGTRNTENIFFFHQAVLAIALCGQTLPNSQCPEDATEEAESLFPNCRTHFPPLCVSVTRCPISSQIHAMLRLMEQPGFPNPTYASGFFSKYNRHGIF